MLVWKEAYLCIVDRKRFFMVRFMIKVAIQTQNMRDTFIISQASLSYWIKNQGHKSYLENVFVDIRKTTTI